MDKTQLYTTARLKSKWDKKTEKKTLTLKRVNQETVKQTINRMHKKKSECSDGITQEQLILGSKTLISPLTQIINLSIESGTFPEAWKEAYVTPVLKKVDWTISYHYSYNMISNSQFIP